MVSLYEKGIHEFNRGYFFEAHDVWEELWMETTGEKRLFYQGLIQSAVGLYHLSLSNYKGASSQLDKALSKLGHYLPKYDHIATDELVADLTLCLNHAENLRSGEIREMNAGVIPTIRWVG